MTNQSVRNSERSPTTSSPGTPPTGSARLGPPGRFRSSSSFRARANDQRTLGTQARIRAVTGRRTLHAFRDKFGVKLDRHSRWSRGPLIAGTSSVPELPVIGCNPIASDRRRICVHAGNWAFTHCLPCRRSWVRVPSAASEGHRLTDVITRLAMPDGLDGRATRRGATRPRTDTEAVQPPCAAIFVRCSVSVEITMHSN
jgi:hypothetical protein